MMLSLSIHFEDENVLNRFVHGYFEKKMNVCKVSRVMNILYLNRSKIMQMIRVFN